MGLAGLTAACLSTFKRMEYITLRLIHYSQPLFSNQFNFGHRADMQRTCFPSPILQGNHPCPAGRQFQLRFSRAKLASFTAIQSIPAPAFHTCQLDSDPGSAG